MRWPVRIRIELARKPWLVWAIVAALCGAAALVLLSELSSVRAARRAWGEQREVFVATRAVAPGTPVADGAIERRAVPVLLLPQAAATHLDPSAVIVRELSAGEIVVDADVGAGDPRFALVPPGAVVVALPRPSVLAPLLPGDRVQVTGATETGEYGSTDAVVTSVSAEVVMVAVAPADATAVAVAAADQVHPPVIVLVPARK